MKHEKFNYKSVEEIEKKAAELGVHLPFAENTEVLKQPLKFGNVTVGNRPGIAPMEGADALPDGALFRFSSIDVDKRKFGSL